MDNLFSQETFKSLATAGVGGGVLLMVGRVLQSIIERRMPSLEVEQRNEQQFRDSLIERIQSLEEARDKLAKDSADFGQRYWELSGKYQALETSYKMLEASNILLQQQHNNLLDEYRKLRKRLDAVTQIEIHDAQVKGNGLIP